MENDGESPKSPKSPKPNSILEEEVTNSNLEESKTPETPPVPVETEVVTTSGGEIGENGDINIKMEMEEDDNSSTGSKEQEKKPEMKPEDFDSVVQLLERDHQQLNTLRVLKEREWNAILKLTKLKEIRITRLKRHREVQGMMMNGDNTSLAKIMRHLSEIERSVGIGNKREVEARNNIRGLEQEVQILAQEVLNNDDEDGQGGTQSLDSLVDRGARPDVTFLASHALKSLVKNRSAHASPPTEPPKPVLEGRQGQKIDVCSLIADYRSKTSQEFGSKNRSPRSVVYTPLSQATNVSFTELLNKCKSIYEKEKDLNNSIPSIVVNNTKSTVQGSKVKGGGVAAGGGTTPAAAMGTSNKAAVGTTLAKLLSSDNSPSQGRSRVGADADSFNVKPSLNNSTGSEKNLSLANLLASSKGRDEPQKKKLAPSADIVQSYVCQGCHQNKAQFVCAGCANQWYCSRECQVAAWDEHAEMCSC